MGRRKYPDVEARRAEILRRFGPQARPIVVAVEMGLNYQTAISDLRALGRVFEGSGRRPGDGNKDTAKRYAAVLRAVQADPSRSLRSIGAEFTITGEAVRLIIAKAGLPPKPHSQRINAKEAAA